jgi:hypothetical protein
MRLGLLGVKKSDGGGWQMSLAIHCETQAWP